VCAGEQRRKAEGGQKKNIENKNKRKERKEVRKK
jgi:hypothetical protein